MSTPRLDIVSIGTLSRNLLWKESEAVRTAHATSTLVRSGKHALLVDPGLPPPAMKARLFERTGLTPNDVTEIFLTNFRSAHRAGLPLFNHATVFIHEVEQQWARQQIERAMDRAEQEDQPKLRAELELLESCRSAEDKLADGVDLFPLFGYTPGSCGLLVSTALTTTLIAGDAVATLDHFLAGQVLPDSVDIAAAGEAMREVYEIADLVVPGHDNIFVNPRMQGM